MRMYLFLCRMSTSVLCRVYNYSPKVGEQRVSYLPEETCV
jgi:hypothetical protein